MNDDPAMHTSYAVKMLDACEHLRTAFFAAVPEAYDDHRFPEMMGSPLSVIHYATLYFESVKPKPNDQL